jgi:predicted phosphohydrolase
MAIYFPPTIPSYKIVCISDIHTTQPLLPHGDILLHAGDLSINGTLAELQSQITWLQDLPHAHKIVIAGNHDVVLSDSEARRKVNWGYIHYLC